MLHSNAVVDVLQLGVAYAVSAGFDHTADGPLACAALPPPREAMLADGAILRNDIPVVPVSLTSPAENAVVLVKITTVQITQNPNKCLN